MILERGIIPPNALFETVNPDIDVDKLRITVRVPDEEANCSEIRLI